MKLGGHKIFLLHQEEGAKQEFVNFLNSLSGYSKQVKIAFLLHLNIITQLKVSNLQVDAKSTTS